MPATLRALAVLIVLGCTGAPWAFLCNRNRSNRNGELFEAIGIGLVAQLVFGIVALRTGHYSAAALALMTVGFVGAGVIACIVWRPRVPAKRDFVWLLVLLGVVLVALFVRQHPSYFVFETGDMGEYVNRANAVAEGANLVQSFPHGFTVFLASTNVLLGEAHTVAGLPALGAVVLLGTMAIAEALGLRRTATLGVALIVVVHPVTVWFSEFPVSEALYAALLIAAVYFLIVARRDRVVGFAIVSGAAMGTMLLVRGNAILLAPLVVAVLVVSAALDDREVFRIQRIATMASLVGLALAYAYNVRFPTQYFVNKQLHDLVPGPLYDVGKNLNLFEVSLPLVLVLIAALAAVWGLAEVVRIRAERRPFRFARTCRIMYVVIIGLTVAILAVMNTTGLREGLGRWGVVVLVLAAAGLVLVVWRPDRYVDGPTGVLIVLGIATYMVLFAERVPNALPHPYYLYLDRYLYSEVLPLALILVAIGLHAAIDAVLEAREHVIAVRVAAGIGLALLVVGLLPAASETWRITRHSLFGDAYGALDRVSNLALPDRDAPIVYSGIKPTPPNWIYGNTYRAFALPLRETFNRNMIGAFASHGDDPRRDPAQARAELAEAGYSSGYLVAIRAPRASPYGNDAHTRYMGTVNYTIPVLMRRLNRSEERFHEIPVDFDVYAIS